MLIACDKTGYMALVKHLTEKSEDWVPGGVPLTMMMNMEGHIQSGIKLLQV